MCLNHQTIDGLVLLIFAITLCVILCNLLFSLSITSLWFICVIALCVLQYFQSSLYPADRQDMVYLGKTQLSKLTQSRGPTLGPPLHNIMLIPSLRKHDWGPSVHQAVTRHWTYCCEHCRCPAVLKHTFWLSPLTLTLTWLGYGPATRTSWGALASSSYPRNG